jgi:hypothetical protein
VNKQQKSIIKTLLEILSIKEKKGTMTDVLFLTRENAVDLNSQLTFTVTVRGKPTDPVRNMKLIAA